MPTHRLPRKRPWHSRRPARDVIDIGGESTRPGAVAVSAAEEAARVIPVIRALAGRLRVPISVDTSKAEVAREALAAGAALVNDVSGLQHDPAMAPVVAEAGAALVLMHTRGRPDAMYAEAHYENLVTEVVEELSRQVLAAPAACVPRGQIISDRGVGFAKRAEHSYGVLARLCEFAHALDLPVLAGPSRKSFKCAPRSTIARPSSVTGERRRR